MRTHKAAELISLALTVPTVIFGIMVAVIWGRSILKRFGAEDRAATDWLILGVVISFIGSGLDNIYWGITWGADFFSLESSSSWFRNGVYANIPFRQTAGIVAALCHLRGAVSWSSKEGGFGAVSRIIRGAWILCGLTFLALYLCL